MSKIEANIILDVSEVTIGYGAKDKEVVVASNINFNLKKGQLVGLIGANGIGKSTLLRTLIKAQPILEGQIKLNGILLQNIAPADLAQQLSIVLTEPVVSKNLTVYELVALGRHPYTNWIGKLSSTDIDKVNNALDLVKITDLKDRKCYELSDGQLQKVMIARALAQDTDIIVLDEPTTHLDMYHKAYILKLLKRLTQKTGKTILFSSHEIELAIELSDSILLIKDDGFIQSSSDELINSDVLNDIFPGDLIVFDKNLKTFKLK